MWLSIQAKSPIWYFDATGSIIKKIAKQSLPYLYSIVTHDESTKSIIPIAEFITTSHTSLSISNELNYIRDTLNTKILSARKKCLPAILVTDFSWALINAVMKSLNNCSIVEYINWTYDVLCNKKLYLQDAMYTIHYICAVHFLRIIIKKAKNEAGNNKDMLKRFIFTFTIIQNATSFDKLEKTFKDLFNLFCQHNKNDLFNESLNTITIELSNRGANVIDFDSEPEKNGKECLRKENVFFFLKRIQKQLKKIPYLKNILKTCLMNA